MPQYRTLIWVSLLLIVALSAVACGSDEPEEAMAPTMEGMAMADASGDLDTSTTKLTEGEAFQVSVSSNLDPLSLNEIHSWTVHVETADGEAVENGEISVDGGMPEHNHGFPTTPEITDELGGGDYLLEGVKFSMAGWWELKLDITAGGQTDSVTFNIVLP